MLPPVYSMTVSPGFSRPSASAREITAWAIRSLTLPDGTERPGVASLGIRPTFSPPQELLEAHLFDFEGDLYGQTIEVALHAWIREEKKFDGMDALAAAMREDEAKARHLLALD